MDARSIDAWNIYQASRRAMTNAVTRLSLQPDYLLIDALHLDLLVEQKPLIKGDARSVSIAAASILAKVDRDLLMNAYDREYPQYGLASNKGYATADHLAALRAARPLAAASLLVRAGARGRAAGPQAPSSSRCHWPGNPRVGLPPPVSSPALQPEITPLMTGANLSALRFVDLPSERMLA